MDGGAALCANVFFNLCRGVSNTSVMYNKRAHPLGGARPAFFWQKKSEHTVGQRYGADACGKRATAVYCPPSWRLLRGLNVISISFADSPIAAAHAGDGGEELHQCSITCTALRSASRSA